MRSQNHKSRESERYFTNKLNQKLDQQLHFNYQNERKKSIPHPQDNEKILQKLQKFFAVPHQREIESSSRRRHKKVEPRFHSSTTINFNINNTVNYRANPQSQRDLKREKHDSLSRNRIHHKNHVDYSLPNNLVSNRYYGKNIYIDNKKQNQIPHSKPRHYQKEKIRPISSSKKKYTKMKRKGGIRYSLGTKENSRKN